MHRHDPHDWASEPYVDEWVRRQEAEDLIRPERFARATCIAQDGSEPMLERARTRAARYGERFKAYRSDLFDGDWLPSAFGPFDAVVSSICLHNLRDFTRISQIY